MDESRARSRHPDSLGQAFLWALLPTLLLVLNAPDPTYAQVVTNIEATTGGSLDLGTNVDTGGSTTQITGGTRPLNGTNPGTNLFHSFDFFTLGTGDVAHFMNDMQLPTTNIIGRVIGGEVSTIDGTLRTNNPLNAADPMNFGAAHLWLVNPSGLLLGPNARVEVGGSVSMSTANYLKFAGTSTLFDMLSTPASLGQLSVAPVVAFGFLGPDLPAPIMVQGSALSVPSGQSISLVGGKVVIQGTTLPDGTVQPARLSAPNGRIQLASTASPGEFNVTTLLPLPNVDGTSFTSFGSVFLASGSSIDVSGASTVFVKGGQLVLSVNDATLTTSASPAQLDTVSLSQGSSIVTSNSGAEHGADVQITVGNLNLDGTATFITTKTFGPGRGGDVNIITADSLLANKSFIRTQTSGLGTEGGDLLLNVGRLRLLDGSLIRSTNDTGLDVNGDGKLDVGVGGNIHVTVQGTTQGANSTDGSAVLSGGSGITSVAESTSGGGGQISIRAKSLDLDGASTTIKSSTFASKIDLDGDGVVDFTGRGGDIVVAVQHLKVKGGATISSNTLAGGSSAAAGGTVTVQGLGEEPEPNAGSVRLSDPNTGIVSASFGAGVPGDVTVNAGILTITKGAAISAGTSTSTGPAGSVTVNADSIVISAAGQILSESFNQNAGKVAITAHELTLDHGSINTNTHGDGLGGNVVLDVGTVSLTNGASISSQSKDSSTGRAGNITMTGGSLTLANHSEITSSSGPEASGNAGNILIQGLASPANSVTITDSSLLTTAENTGQGGSITVNATNLTLNNATISASVKDVPAGGDPKASVGNIALSASAMTMNGSNVTTESSGSRNAGDISINSKSVPGNTFEMQNNSTINTSAALSDGGNIGIYATNMVRLTDSIITSSVGNETKIDTLGGNVTIDPQFVILQNSQIRANAFAGSGGAINIIAGSAFIADPASIVSASSTLGISGPVIIESPVQNVGGRLTPLSQQFSSAAALLAQRCAARVADGKFSTFVVAGREGLPAEPGGFLASPSLTAELLGSSLSGRYPHTPIAAVAGSFPEYDARPIQLAKYGDACHQ